MSAELVAVIFLRQSSSRMVDARHSMLEGSERLEQRYQSIPLTKFLTRIVQIVRWTMPDEEGLKLQAFDKTLPISGQGQDCERCAL